MKNVLLQHGFAPGSYFFKCSECLETAIGDKRSLTCERCATELATIHATGVLNKLVTQLGYLLYLQQRFSSTEPDATPIDLPLAPVYETPEEIGIALRYSAELNSIYAANFEAFLSTEHSQSAITVYRALYGILFEKYDRPKLKDDVIKKGQ